MSKKYDFEYIIIGGGPAGISTALTLSKSKKRIALIEKAKLGGMNVNMSDIPYSSALDFSHFYSKVLSIPEFKNQEPHFNFPTFINNRAKLIKKSRENLTELLKTAGVAHIESSANFLDPHTIAIGKNKLTSKNFILATGSKLKTTGINNIENVDILTPLSILNLTRLPKVILVIGGGSTGCEIASYLSELGVKVIIMEAEKRLLPKEDKEISESLTEYFKKELNIIPLPNCKVVSIENDGNAKRVTFKAGRSEKVVRINNIVLATGYEPVLDYGLENAKVKYKDTGILVNRYFETSSKNIYAVGDAIQNSYINASSTARSDYEGTFLASNLLNKTKNLINYDGFTRVTKTYPEIVSIGPSEEQLKKSNKKYKKSIIRFNTILNSPISNFDYGLVKLISDWNGRLVAGSIISPNAEDLASELSLAIRHHLPVIEIASTPHPINNYSYAIKLAARKLIQKK